MTRTFATLEVSPATFNEIFEKLSEAEYHHAFVDDHIDMHGIGLWTKKVEKALAEVQAEDAERGLIPEPNGDEL